MKQVVLLLLLVVVFHCGVCHVEVEGWQQGAALQTRVNQWPGVKRGGAFEWARSVNLSRWYSDWELCLIGKNDSNLVRNFKDDVWNCLKKKKKVAFRCSVGGTYYCEYYLYIVSQSFILSFAS